MSELDTTQIDNGLISELRARLRQAEKENERYRAILAGESDQLERDNPTAALRASSYWFAQWQEGNRRRSELLLRNETDKQRIATALELPDPRSATVGDIMEAVWRLRGVTR